MPSNYTDVLSFPPALQFTDGVLGLGTKRTHRQNSPQPGLLINKLNYWHYERPEGFHKTYFSIHHISFTVSQVREEENRFQHDYKSSTGPQMISLKHWADFSKLCLQLISMRWKETIDYTTFAEFCTLPEPEIDHSTQFQETKEQQSLLDSRHQINANRFPIDLQGPILITYRLGARCFSLNLSVPSRGTVSWRE